MHKDQINAYPRKKLFIDILTQDVNVKTCILDLIDNSADSYVVNKIADRREIKLTITDNEFEILDTCGGISKSTLKSDVFRFGANNLKRNNPTLGMYGIGLKRSVFKMGNFITFETDDGKDYSLMEMDVKKWEAKNEHDWDIPFETEKSNIKGKELPYTKIKVTKLDKEVSEKFSLVSFKDDILLSLKRVYCLIMRDNIDFFLNEKKIIPYQLIVPYDNDYMPSVHVETYNGLDIQIVCFIDPSKGTRLKDSVNTIGWNVFCNNRLILANDILPKTGWIGGNDKSVLPKYHTIYNEFRGIVFLKSNNPFNLPLNTSKSDLNIEDKNYHYILNKMIKTARPVIDFLTRKYNTEKEEEDAIEEKIEDTIDNNYNPNVKNADEIKEKSEFKAPTQKNSKKASIVNICFTAEKKIAEKVKINLNVKSYKEVGEKLLDYYIDMEELKNE